MSTIEDGENAGERCFGPADLVIDEATYERAVAAAAFVERRLGMRVMLFADGADPTLRLRDGHIFVFNHFARFETVVPGYLIHRAIGAHCRTLAHSALFQGPEKLARLLARVGAVPTKMEGVLPFLAAEALKGRKIVIFPEGGMIKDRRVTDATGALGIYSPTSMTLRKHHSGAAALALVLEVFKERIRSVARSGEEARLARWARALEIDDIAQLIARAEEPTRVVPGAITFHPIRGEESVATRRLTLVARLLAGEIGPSFLEELVVEGNILFAETDMDIRLGPPQEPAVAWSWWERRFLAGAFARIDSLEELFDAAAKPAGLVDRVASRLTHHNIKKLRDRCMEEIYRHVSVNLAHLASRLLLDLHAAGARSIEERRFETTLYAALKKTQAADGVFLHRGVEDPAAYRGLIDGSSACRDWTRLRDRAVATGLIARRDGALDLLAPLGDPVAARYPRLDRIVQVYANELDPIKAALAAVAEAAAEPPPAGAALSLLRFDDERRAHQRAERLDASDRFSAVAEREAVTGAGAPFLHLPQRRRPLGVLLAHGFLASPDELAAFGAALARRGHAVLGARLEGHGASPFDLRTKSWTDWLQSLERSYAILAPHVERIAIIGMSTGAMLSLRLAADRPEKLAGVAAVAPTLKIRSKGLALAPAMHAVNRLSQWRWEMEGAWPFQPIETDHPEIGYRSVPVRALFELKRAVDDAYRSLGSVQCPVRILHAERDHVVDPQSAKLIRRQLRHTACELLWVDSDRHQLILEQIGPTWDWLTGFLDRLEAPRERRILG